MKRRNGHDPATPEGARQDADRPVADESDPAPEGASVEMPRATEFGISALEAIRSAIQGVSEYVTSTAAAVEEQSTVTSEMSSSMQRAASEAAAIAAA